MNRYALLPAPGWHTLVGQHVGDAGISPPLAIHRQTAVTLAAHRTGRPRASVEAFLRNAEGRGSARVYVAGNRGHENVVIAQVSDSGHIR